MAETSGFFESVNDDRQYEDSFLATFIASIVSNGVYNGELAVAASGNGMEITLPAGRAWINGYFYQNDAPISFTVDTADGVLNRKDILILRMDTSARSITAQIVKGNPASSATAPAIVRSTEQYDLKVSEISIPAGTTTITQSLITDCRPDESVCGFVAGAVQQIDTGTLYQQLTDSFNTWFQQMKDQLTTDAAGNLQEQIDNIKLVMNPVGTIIYNNTGINPGAYIGGTWEAYAKGQAIVGVDPNDNDFKTAGQAIGSKTHTHSFVSPVTYQANTSVVIPRHDDYLLYNNALDGTTTTEATHNITGHVETSMAAYGVSYETTKLTSSNVQPSIPTYVWIRTA